MLLSLSDLDLIEIKQERGSCQAVSPTAPSHMPTPSSDGYTLYSMFATVSAGHKHTTVILVSRAIRFSLKFLLFFFQAYFVNTKRSLEQ